MAGDGRIEAYREAILAAVEQQVDITLVEMTEILRAERDCQEFRVWAGIKGKKEPYDVPTQRTYDSQ
jgi:hypothetical protein